MSDPRIVLPASDANVDADVPIRLAGFRPDSQVELRASFTDHDGATWRSHAVFATDWLGSVDVMTARPLSGTWDEAHGHGLFWSMSPVPPDEYEAFKRAGRPADEAGPGGHRMGLPGLRGDAPLRVDFTAISDGKQAAAASLVRHRFPPNVREVVVHEGQIRGRVFEPENADGLPGVVMIAGSGGGIGRERAALMAAHGFSVFALGYFNFDDLPTHQVRIPLEYFREAFHWFREHLGHDRIGLTGGSKGGEGTLVVATAWPDLVKAAVPVVPGDLYLCAANEKGERHAAWTLGGEDLPWAGTPADWARIPPEHQAPKPGELFNTRLNMEAFYAAPDVHARAAIPVERMACPMLLIWAGDDQAWPSQLAVERLLRRLDEHDYRHPYRDLTVEGAGHFCIETGYPTVMADTALHPLLPIYMTMGGSPVPTARLQREAWQARIGFFRDVL